ncbi:ATP-binding protein [Arthrobacter sp. ISL-48]|nr:ATP-binding protein [Arthrobacter sp. ISL-48]
MEANAGTVTNGQLVLLCGRSFSGKSTVALQLSTALPADVVSLDMINEERGLFGGQGVPVEEWIRTHEIATAEVLELLSRARTVVVDDTSSPRFLRDKWRSAARSVGAAFALVFVDTTEEVLLQRHRVNRSALERHDVTDSVMMEHLEGFEAPEPDEAFVSFEPESESYSELITRTRSALNADP